MLRSFLFRSTCLIRCIWPALAAMLLASPAMADFRMCNNTGSRVGVAVGYRDKQGWLTEGWWNVLPRSCETVLKGVLAARYYYVYALDYDQGGEWSGKSFMCTREKEFTVRGFDNCLARGYDRTGFFEIDSGDQTSWTVQLSEQAQTGAKPKSSAPADVSPPPAGSPSALPQTPEAPAISPEAPATSAPPPVVSPAPPVVSPPIAAPPASPGPDPAPAPQSDGTSLD